MPENFVRYLPENTAPVNFMQPPTSPFRPQLRKSGLAVVQKIDQAAAELYTQQQTKEARMPFIKARQTPRLRIGSELEFLLFSADSIPQEDRKKADKDNPNYDPSHLQNVKDLSHAILSNRHGLGKRLEHRVTTDRIFMEIRTLPSTIKQYQDTMDRIKEWVHNTTTELGIHPVIMSQHFHFSLTGSEGRVNLMENKGMEQIAKIGLTDMYHRALPFVRLPEDLDDSPTVYYIGDTDGVRQRGEWDTPSNPYRIEGRVNNSEYAFDPDLNLLVNLMGLQRGLAHGQDIYNIADDYPLGSFGRDLYFATGKDGVSYKDALDHVLDDAVLATGPLGKMLFNLYQVHSWYPDISRGKMLVKDAREEAAALLIPSPKSEEIFIYSK